LSGKFAYFNEFRSLHDFFRYRIFRTFQVCNQQKAFVTVQRYAIMLSSYVCLSVRPSVTSRCSTETAKLRMMQTTPHDSPGTLVFRQ